MILLFFSRDRGISLVFVTESISLPLEGTEQFSTVPVLFPCLKKEVTVDLLTKEPQALGMPFQPSTLFPCQQYTAKSEFSVVV